MATKMPIEKEMMVEVVKPSTKSMFPDEETVNIVATYMAAIIAENKNFVEFKELKKFKEKAGLSKNIQRKVPGVPGNITKNQEVNRFLGIFHPELSIKSGKGINYLEFSGKVEDAVKVLDTCKSLVKVRESILDIIPTPTPGEEKEEKRKEFINNIKSFPDEGTLERVTFFLSCVVKYGTSISADQIKVERERETPSTWPAHRLLIVDHASQIFNSRDETNKYLKEIYSLEFAIEKRNKGLNFSGSVEDAKRILIDLENIVEIPKDIKDIVSKSPVQNSSDTVEQVKEQVTESREEEIAPVSVYDPSERVKFTKEHIIGEYITRFERYSGLVEFDERMAGLLKDIYGLQLSVPELRTIAENLTASFLVRVKRPYESLVKNYPSLTFEVEQKFEERDAIYKVSYQFKEESEMEVRKLLNRIDEFDGEFVTENWFLKYTKSRF